MFRRLFHFATDSSGAALLEFTIVLPVMLALMFGAFQFGIIIRDLNMLATATSAGARQLSIGRGDSTPYTDTVNKVKASASNLTQSYLQYTVTINGTACSTDSACQTALN